MPTFDEDYVASPFWEHVKSDSLTDIGLVNEISGKPIKFGVQFSTKRAFFGSDVWTQVFRNVTSDQPTGYLIVTPRVSRIFRRGNVLSELPIRFIRPTNGQMVRTIYRRNGLYIFAVDAPGRSFFEVARVSFSDAGPAAVAILHTDLPSFETAFELGFGEAWNPEGRYD